MRDCIKFVGLDVHKSTIALAIAEADRLPPISYGQIENTPETITRLVKRLSKGNSVRFCYEAGPCGHEVHRQITTLGHRCDVVAPSLIPRKAGDRIKTDRRDAQSLARLYRAGELTAVWVPDQEQEAVRDLVRTREDMKGIELRVRQRLGAFLLHHGMIYTARAPGARRIPAGWRRYALNIPSSRSSFRNTSMPSSKRKREPTGWKSRCGWSCRVGIWPRPWRQSRRCGE